MKTWHKSLIGIAISLFILVVAVIVTLVVKLSWVLFWVLLIIECIVWIVIGTILISNWVAKKNIITEQMDLADTKKFAKQLLAKSEDNPDNFIIENFELNRVGEPGSERTPVRVLYGKGSETNKKIVFIINLEDRNEFTLLLDPRPEEIKEKIIKISKRQPETETYETIPGGVNEVGQVLPARVKVTKVSRAEVKKEEEKKEGEEKAAF